MATGPRDTTLESGHELVGHPQKPSSNSSEDPETGRARLRTDPSERSKAWKRADQPIASAGCTLAEVTETERRWLDYAWIVANCTPEHRRTCEDRGGAPPGAKRQVGNDLRWPGYLGRKYDERQGLLCVGHVHRERTGAELTDVDAMVERALVGTTQRWRSQGRSARNDASYLAGVRDAFEEWIPIWLRWSKGFKRVVEGELGMDLTQIAWTNLAKCRYPRPGSPPDKLLVYCQGTFPMREVVDAIRPRAVLCCVLQAHEGGSIVKTWNSDHAQPLVFTWHGLHSTDHRGRKLAEWAPEAGLRIRLAFADSPER